MRRDWPALGMGSGLVLVIIASAIFLFLAGCAPAPRVVMVPHVCGPEGDSAAYQKCRADCPDGSAFVLENAKDTFCVCKKNPSQM